MLYQKGHNITSIYAPKDNGGGSYSIKKITTVYRYSKKLWEAITSCFGKGFWINTESWTNNEGWANNVK